MPLSPEVLSYDLKQAVAASGGVLSRAGIYRAAAAGNLSLKKKGKRTFVLASELRRYLAEMPDFSSSAHGAKAA